MGNSDNVNDKISDEIDNTTVQDEFGTDIDIITLDEIDDVPTADNTETDDSEAVTDKPIAKRKHSVSDYIRYAVMVISICVFVFAVGKLINIYYHYSHDRKIYESLDALAVDENDKSGALPTNSDGEINADKVILPQTVDYSVLKKINDDYVGWIQIPSVNISYPMVLGDDNSYYLTHSYNNEFSWSGAIFLDYNSTEDFSDFNTLIYGHHMKDGSMFCGLLKYLDEDFYSSSSNYIYIYMENKTYIYQIFCVSEQDSTNSQSFKRVFTDSFTFGDYVDYIKDTELYSTGVSCTDQDKVITLITCKIDSEDPTRVIVHGKLVATVPKQG